MDVLEEREKTHGSFTDVSYMSQVLKGELRTGESWDRMSFQQSEALEMICTKLARIVSGNPDEPDHWLDIEGYARLARESIDK